MTHDHKKGTVFALFLALAAAFFFGAATPLGKLLLTELNPFLISGLMYLGAGLGLSPKAFVGKRRERQAIDGRNRLFIGAMILFGGLLGPLLLYFGLQSAQASDVSLWLNLEAVFTAATGALFFKERLGPRGWLGVLAGVAAGLVLSVMSASPWVAGLLVAGACLCWAIDNHVTALIDGITPTRSTAIKGLVAGTVNCAIGFSLQSSISSPWTIPLALVVGFFSYGMSVALYITAAQSLGATRSQLAFSASPLFGVGLSAIVLGEAIGFQHLASIALLAIALALLMSEHHLHTHGHAALEHVHRHRHDDGHHAHAHEGAEPLTGGYHVHVHAHEPVQHEHPHFPDLHHRHDHAKED